MPTFLTPYLFWIKLSLGAIAVAGAFAGGFWLEGTIKDRDILSLKLAASQKQAADVTASLDQLQGFISNMHVAATDYFTLQAALFGKLDALHGEFLNATKTSPLPPDCKPDDVRVRSLSAAISATNFSTAGTIISPVVSATP